MTQGKIYYSERSGRKYEVVEQKENMTLLKIIEDKYNPSMEGKIMEWRIFPDHLKEIK